MQHYKDYIRLDCINHFEFGLALHDTSGGAIIQIVVVDHENYKVRIIDETHSLEYAFQFLIDCIQQGFYAEGLMFTGIPGYSIPCIKRLQMQR